MALHPKWGTYYFINDFQPDTTFLPVRQFYLLKYFSESTAYFSEKDVLVFSPRKVLLSERYYYATRLWPIIYYFENYFSRTTVA